MRPRARIIVYVLVLLGLVAAGPCRHGTLGPPPTTPEPNQPIVPQAPTVPQT